MKIVMAHAVVNHVLAAIPVVAYLDMGTGSMLVQLILGGVAGVLTILKLYWKRIEGLFKGKRAEDLPTDKADTR